MVGKNSQQIPFFHKVEVCHPILGSHFGQGMNSNSFSRQVYTPVLASEVNPISETAMASWEFNIPNSVPPSHQQSSHQGPPIYCIIK